MQVFVTGGSGFVGRALVAALVARGDSVRALARTEKAAATLRSAGAEPVIGDLDSPTALADGVAGCETVFHAAAILNFAIDAATQQRVNVAGTRNVLAAARAAGVARFVFVGAASVLANGAPLLAADETTPIPPDVVGPYSRTKAEAERLVLAANAPGFTTVAVRPPGVWGGLDGGLVPQLLELVQKGRFVWFDHGRYPYVTCHVANVVEGTLLAAEHGRGGEAYFLTDGEPTLFRDIVRGMLETQGMTIGERSVPRRAILAVGSAFDWLWRTFRLHGAPPLSREAVALIGPFVVRDAKARRELGYIGHMSRAAGLAALRPR